MSSLEIFKSDVSSKGVVVYNYLRTCCNKEMTCYPAINTIAENTRLSVSGGFAPKSQSAEELAKSMGTYTVLTGSVTRGRENSKSLQMAERPLMTSDEIKSIKKGNFIVLKTGFNPMKSKFNLFLKWGITFDSKFTVSENNERVVKYSNKNELKRAMGYGATKRRRETVMRSMTDADFEDFLKTE